MFMFMFGFMLDMFNVYLYVYVCFMITLCYDCYDVDITKSFAYMLFVLCLLYVIRFRGSCAKTSKEDLLNISSFDIIKKGENEGF